MSALDLYMDVKPHLNISDETDDLDVELQQMLDAAEAAVGTRVGPLTPVPVTERVWATRKGTLLLSRWPVASLTSVTTYDGTAADLTAVDFSAGLLAYYSGATSFSDTSSAYTVVYQHGWSAVPADIRLATLELVRHLWTTQRGSGAGRPGPRPSTDVANTVPGAAYAFPIRVEQLLEPYRAPRVG